MKNLFEEISGRLSFFGILQGILVLTPNIKYAVLQAIVIIICLYLLFLVSSSILDQCKYASSTDYYAPQIKWVVVVLYFVSIVYFPIFFSFRSGFVFMILLILFFVTRTELHPGQMKTWKEVDKVRFHASSKMRHRLGYIFLFAALFYLAISFYGEKNIIYIFLTMPSFADI